MAGATGAISAFVFDALALFAGTAYHAPSLAMKVGGGAALPEAAAAFFAKGIDVAVVGLGTALAAVTDENLCPRCRPG